MVSFRREMGRHINGKGDLAVSVNNWLTRREMLAPDKIALIDMLHDGMPITYREWNRRANRTANFLREGLQLQKGDRDRGASHELGRIS